MNRTFNRIPFAGLLLVVLFTLSGCAGLTPGFERPKVTLADIQIREINTLETAFQVQLRVMNPNDTPLEVRGISCELELDGRQFATGVQGGQYTVEPFASALIPVDVYASVLDMVNSVIGLLQGARKNSADREAISYQATGTVRVSTGGFSQSIPFSTAGELRLN